MLGFEGYVGDCGDILGRGSKESKMKSGKELPQFQDRAQGSPPRTWPWLLVVRPTAP